MYTQVEAKPCHATVYNSVYRPNSITTQALPWPTDFIFTEVTSKTILKKTIAC